MHPSRKFIIALRYVYTLLKSNFLLSIRYSKLYDVGYRKLSPFLSIESISSSSFSTISIVAKSSPESFAYLTITGFTFFHKSFFIQ